MIPPPGFVTAEPYAHVLLTGGPWHCPLDRWNPIGQGEHGPPWDDVYPTAQSGFSTSWHDGFVREVAGWPSHEAERNDSRAPMLMSSSVALMSKQPVDEYVLLAGPVRAPAGLPQVNVKVTGVPSGTSTTSGDTLAVHTDATGARHTVLGGTAFVGVAVGVGDGVAVGVAVEPIRAAR
jgi:hypothetical protein